MKNEFMEAEDKIIATCVRVTSESRHVVQV
jgi:hypothetical protein